MSEGLFYSAWDFLIKSGFVDIIVPLILVYALVYALLERTKILGDLNRDPAAAGRAGIISLSVAIIFTATRYAVYALKLYLPYILLFGIIAFFVMLAIVAVYFYSLKKEEIEKGPIIDKKLAYAIIGITLFVIATFFLYITGLLQWLLFGLASAGGGSTPSWVSDLINLLVTFGILFGIVKWVTGEPSFKKSGGNTQNNGGGQS